MRLALAACSLTDKKPNDTTFTVVLRRIISLVLSFWLAHSRQLGHRSDESITLSGDISEQHSGYGAVSVSHAGIGSPDGGDGLVIVDNNNNVLQFLSHEGRWWGVFRPREENTVYLCA